MDTVSIHFALIAGGYRLLLQWNACSTYNLLAEEGRRVAAALLPQNGELWNVKQ